MNNPSYLSLYVILDIEYLKNSGKDPCKALISCLKGGATCIQLRSKMMNDRDFYVAAVKMKKICSAYKVPFIINDRVDIAALVRADGVHIGKEDLPYDAVKKIFKGIIGVSADSVKESISMDRLRSSYIGVGPVYPTSQKDKKAIGPVLIKKISRSLSTPVVAIGGINGYNIPELKASGIRYFSFISGILGEKNILAQTKKIRQLILNKEK